MRMTVATCVMLLELSNNLALLPLMMLVTLVAKVCVCVCVECHSSGWVELRAAACGRHPHVRMTHIYINTHVREQRLPHPAPQTHTHTTTHEPAHPRTHTPRTTTGRR
jgi:hypothetical protein